MIRIAIVGAAGRMGRELIRVVANTSACTLAAAVVRADAQEIDTDAGCLIDASPLGVRCTTDAAAALAACDVAIDFTTPDATLEHLALAKNSRTPLVIGTTGFTDAQRATIAAAAREIPIVLSANFSIGVNILLTIARNTAQTLGRSATIHIHEVHHEHKKDAPSGTAKYLSAMVAEASQRALDHISITAERIGEVIGDHTITFDTPTDTITLSHHAKTRAIFAEGAVHAAQWLIDKAPGLYGMDDVLAREHRH